MPRAVVRSSNWSNTEIMLLMQLYQQQNFARPFDGTRGDCRGFDMIAAHLCSQGAQRTSKQVREKINNLKQAHRRSKERAAEASLYDLMVEPSSGDMVSVFGGQNHESPSSASGGTLNDPCIRQQMDLLFGSECNRGSFNLMIEGPQTTQDDQSSNGSLYTEMTIESANVVPVQDPKTGQPFWKSANASEVTNSLGLAGFKENEQSHDRGNTGYITVAGDGVEHESACATDSIRVKDEPFDQNVEFEPPESSYKPPHQRDQTARAGVSVATTNSVRINIEDLDGEDVNGLAEVSDIVVGSVHGSLEQTKGPKMEDENFYAPDLDSGREPKPKRLRLSQHDAANQYTGYLPTPNCATSFTAASSSSTECRQAQKPTDSIIPPSTLPSFSTSDALSSLFAPQTVGTVTMTRAKTPPLLRTMNKSSLPNAADVGTPHTIDPPAPAVPRTTGPSMAPQQSPTCASSTSFSSTKPQTRPTFTSRKTGFTQPTPFANTELLHAIRVMTATYKQVEQEKMELQRQQEESRIKAQRELMLDIERDRAERSGRIFDRLNDLVEANQKALDKMSTIVGKLVENTETFEK